MKTSIVRFNLDTLVDELHSTLSWAAAQIAQIENGIYQIALFNGAFEYHTHAEDKIFIVYKGDITFYIKNGGEEEEYTLGSGDGIIIPANIERRRIAHPRALILTFDTSGHKGEHGTGPGQHQHLF